MRVIPALLLTIAILGIGFQPAQSAKVVSTNPANNQLNFFRAHNITAQFDTVMSAVTINDTTFFTYSFQTGRLPGGYSTADVGSTAVFDPTPHLHAGEVIEAIVTTDITSAGGVPLDTAYVWRFTVAVVDNGDSLHADPLWLSTPVGPTRGVALGDYDGDGDLDAAFANNGANAVYRNDGGPLTTVPVWTSTPVNFTADVAWADYDGDGDLDLSCGNYFVANTIYRNDAGTLTTSPTWSSAPANGTVAIAWGDYDGDGDLDLACSNLNQPNTLYRNDGGTLTTVPVWSTTAALNSRDLEWGDYDNDGDLDLVVANTGAADVIYRNDAGVLTTSPVWSAAASLPTESVAWGDYDGDGDLDLACGCTGLGSKNNNVYRNEAGTLTTVPVWSSTPANETFAVAWGDYDGDGDLDLACGNYSGQANTVYRNDAGVLTANPVWSSDSTYNTVAIAWGDMDDDNDLDLVCANFDTHPNTAYYNASAPVLLSTDPAAYEHDVVRTTDVETTFDIPLNLSTLTDATLPIRSFQTGLHSGTYSTANGGATGVFTPDSSFVAGETIEVTITTDVASSVGFPLEDPYVWRFTAEVTSDGDSLDPEVAWMHPSPYFWVDDVEWADYDGDGDLDLACANASPLTSSRVYRNDDSVFVYDYDIDYNRPVRALTWIDFDGDGAPDLVFANENSTSNRGYRNTGTDFQSFWISNPGNTSLCVACGDYDGDGRPDVAFGNDGQPNTVYRNVGGPFTLDPVWSSTEAHETRAVAWIDYDVDGDLDLFCANAGAGEQSELYRNDDGVLTAAAIWLTPGAYPAYDVAVGDYDEDGYPDFALANDGYRIVIYRNKGGYFDVAIPIGPPTLTNVSVAWVDFDGDGDLDLAAGSRTQADRIYPNVGGTIVDNPVWSNTVYGTSITSHGTAWADIDKDGDMDFVKATKPIRVFRTGFAPRSYSPSANEYAAGLSTDLEVEFVGPANPASISPASFTAFGGERGALSGTRTTHTGNTYASFDPDDAFRAGEVIEATITQEASSATGENMVRGHVWRVTAEVPASDSLLTVPVWSVIQAGNREVAWGDYDGDGDLDLACARTGPGLGVANQVYVNNGGTLSSSPVWISNVTFKTLDIDWVDFDSDGDLDLSCTNSQQWNTLYRNDGGTLTPDPVWMTTRFDDTRSAAWGDYDGDGDLDVVYAEGYSDLILLHRNDGGTLTADPVEFFFPSNHRPFEVVWGDIDQDGDLDLACATNTSSYDDVFINEGGWIAQGGEGMRLETPVLQSMRCAALGDYDSDGDLDLACGSTTHTNRLYEFNGTSFDAVWSSSHGDTANCIDFVDYDGDGDLDIAVGVAHRPDYVYANLGDSMSIWSNWQTAASHETYGMDWGDYDGDGDMDVAYACEEGVFVYENFDIWQPSAVQDLSVVSTTDSSITLTWTAGGDDSTAGTASHYDLRYSTSAITVGNFTGGAAAADVPPPQPVGSNETFEVAGLTSGIKYYFALKAADADSNWSDISNNASAYVDLGRPVISSIVDVPNDQGKKVTVTWDASVTDHDFGVEQYVVTEYSVWRWLDGAAFVADDTPVVLKSDEEVAAWYPKRLDAPVIDVQFGGFLAAGTWLYVNTVPALQFDSYAVDAATIADSTGQGIPYHTFMVSAMTASPFNHAESPPDSGYSVDNLTPGAPQNLVLGDADLITWDPNIEEDLDYYCVYAAEVSGLDPDPEHLIGCTSDTTFTLPDSVRGDFVFVTATDFSGNESGPSNEIEYATGVAGEDAIPAVYALHQNVPNPFNPTTTIRFDLPVGTKVTLKIFNVRGQLVRTLVDEDMSAGVKYVTWDGTDGVGGPVATGVYFYRVHAGDFNDTKKMILLK